MTPRVKLRKAWEAMQRDEEAELEEEKKVEEEVVVVTCLCMYPPPHMKLGETRMLRRVVMKETYHMSKETYHMSKETYLMRMLLRVVEIVVWRVVEWRGGV